MGGDIQVDDIGSGYDLIWCSHLLYFFEDKHKIVKKIYDALNPKGIFISAHSETDEKDKQNLDKYFSFLFLNMQEKDALLRPFELSGICEDVGFKKISSYTNYNTPVTQTQMTIAKK